MYPLTIGLAIENRELWDQAQACLGELPFRVIIEQQELGDLSAFVERLERMRPDVILLDIKSLAMPLEQAVLMLKSAVAEPMIIALHKSADADTILSSLRAGVNEYLYPPLGDNLRKALEKRSADRSRRRDGNKAGGKSFAFVSAKGGCGATTLACHVAVELGRLNQKVLLADLDLDAGDDRVPDQKPKARTRCSTRSTTCTGWTTVTGRRWYRTGYRAWRSCPRRCRWPRGRRRATSRCSRCWPSCGRITTGRWSIWDAA